MQFWNGDYGKISSMVSDDFVGHWSDSDVKCPSALEDMIKMTRGYFYDILLFLLLQGIKKYLDIGKRLPYIKEI
ncbi:hypothetical protein GCM10007063_33380 [Lentibacillus kapialis]|uniref:Uncharacterized protein n=1 Tax=Lentibacillus kapialis TaxID=340214 RepID=A0A917Q217_9BACI|nr:hypothetical protein [Lentibacillus kapialis]GGK08314.1 hypothetical protein GCM10007063_33380 [Lentibacillus kapialis]